ncbi:hypothetical protein TNCV_3430021 [Trichonephila clavipes]|nr:hypothetical protein TNCV_3430021 [Trichonephila clavipes]
MNETIQLNSRNETNQLGSRNETTQLCAAVDCLHPPTTACTAFTAESAFLIYCHANFRSDRGVMDIQMIKFGHVSDHVVFIFRS